MSCWGGKVGGASVLYPVSVTVVCSLDFGGIMLPSLL